MDSIKDSVVARSNEIQELAYTFTGLEGGKVYWLKARIVSPNNPSRTDMARALVQKSGKTGKKGGLIKGYMNFFKAGGWYFMAPMHLLMLMALVFWFFLWRRLLFANVFPPNKSSLLYRILPIDRVGKTDMLSNKGNIFLREVAKYWSKAMDAMSVGPHHFATTEEFTKASRQTQEEMEKKLWLEIGLPNVEKAIEICKNGVPGIKLPKRPIEYPTVRVLLAALENHRANRNAYWASQEMDRAAENMVTKESDELKGWEITFLWAVGSIEPMLGLFGTVVGIRQAFMRIETTVRENPNVQIQAIVPELSGGIQLALITTIVGLYFGIPSMLLHYYYRGKVDWIFGKWEEIMTEMLNRA